MSKMSELHRQLQENPFEEPEPRGLYYEGFKGDVPEFKPIEPRGWERWAAHFGNPYSAEYYRRAWYKVAHKDCWGLHGVKRALCSVISFSGAELEEMFTSWDELEALDKAIEVTQGTSDVDKCKYSVSVDVGLPRVRFEPWSGKVDRLGRKVAKYSATLLDQWNELKAEMLRRAKNQLTAVPSCPYHGSSVVVDVDSNFVDWEGEAWVVFRCEECK